MLLSIVAGLEHDTDIELSADKQFLRVRNEEGIRVLNLKRLKEGEATLTEAEQKKASFAVVGAIKASSEKRLILFHCEIQPEDAIPESGLEVLNQGIPFSIRMPLGNDIDGSDNEMDLEFIKLLAKTTNGYAALAVGGIHEYTQLQKGETIVGVMDILGFSDILERLSIADIKAKYGSILKSSLHFAMLMNSRAMVFRDDGTLIEDFEEFAPISFAVFSDTVLIHLKNSDEEFPLEALVQFAALMFDLMLTSGPWLLRGGIDIGTFESIKADNLFLGTALVGAHKLEMLQDWAGIALSNRCVERFPADIARMKKKGLIIEYNIPYKSNDGTESCFCLNWCYFASGLDEKRIPHLESLLKSAPAQARPKIERTLVFVREIQRRGLFSKEPVTARAFNVPASHREVGKKTSKRSKHLSSLENWPSAEDAVEKEEAFVNKIVPVPVMIYENTPGLCAGVFDLLTEAGIGVVLIRSRVSGARALRHFPDVKIFVVDHRFHSQGLQNISGVLMERDDVKKELPSCHSVLLSSDPNDSLASGFRKGGGNYVIDGSRTSDFEIAQFLQELLKKASK